MSPTTAPQDANLSSTRQAAPSPSEDRGPLGRFAKGNKAGRGNPFAREVAQLKSAVLRFLTEDRLALLLEAIFAKACQGDVSAAKLLLQYALGQPSKAVEPDRLDNEEYALLKESAVERAEFMPMMEKCLPADVVCDNVRETWPIIQGDRSAKLYHKACHTEGPGPSPASRHRH